MYDLALGDEVETGPEWGSPYMVQRVVQQSGRYTFRARFGNSPDPAARRDIPEQLARLGYLLEWSSENLLAVDAASDREAQALADMLQRWAQEGRLVYEAGRT